MKAHSTAEIREDKGRARMRDLAALAGRLMMSAIFLLSGIGKITGADSYVGYIGSVGLPFPLLTLWVAIVVELLCSAALVAGFQVRAVGMTLSLFCLTAAFVFHRDLVNPAEFLNFWKNVAIAGGALQLAAFGGGGLSLDARLGDEG